jgi:hypothetical protein
LATGAIPGQSDTGHIMALPLGRETGLAQDQDGDVAHCEPRAVGGPLGDQLLAREIRRAPDHGVQIYVGIIFEHYRPRAERPPKKTPIC